MRSTGYSVSYTHLNFKFINLSGGIGIPYEPEQKANNIAVIGEGVRRAFEKIMVPAGLGDVAIYTELGRFMLGPYGCLVTTCLLYTSHSEGKTHCEECLMLDGCFFMASNHPPCPHHPFCHCTLEPVDYTVVLINASA